MLEESWVLDLVARPGTLDVELDLVFAKTHPELMAPPEGEQFYSRSGRIRFAGVTSLRWTEQGRPPATDANGEADWGHIDELTFDGSSYELSGDFGTIQVTATTFDLSWNSAASAAGILADEL